MAVKVSEHENGVAVYQVTEDPLEKSNIYCETPWCSADGRNFVYQQTPAGNGPNRSEYILCEFGTWKARSVGRGLGAPSINHDGIFHYRRVTKTESRELVRIGPGAPPEIVSGGYRFNHVGVSSCGRFFFCDDWQGDSKLVIGSIETGKNAVVCEAHTSRGRSQNTHGHPYLSPDLKWLVFNSDRTGRPQVYAASVPPEMIDDLEKA